MAQLYLPGKAAKSLLEDIADNWGNVTTIILIHGSVFEFKGPFPKGVEAYGYYNLDGDNGFEGHLGLNTIAEITFQEREHHGRMGHAFVFETAKGDIIFKVFVGRYEDGSLIEEQLKKFKNYKLNALEK